MASSTSTTVPRFAHSIFKSHIVCKNPRVWSTTRRTKNASSSVPIPETRRLICVRLLILPHHLHLRHLSPQIRHRNLLSCPPLPPLLQPRSPLFSTPMSSLADSNPSNTKTVRVVVKGRVQGVFYRNWTVENATELGLKGWVRNRRDGSVEALFSGSPDKVQEMENRCRRGPPAAMVTGLEVVPCSDDPGTRFEPHTSQIFSISNANFHFLKNPQIQNPNPKLPNLSIPSSLNSALWRTATIPSTPAISQMIDQHTQNNEQAGIRQSTETIWQIPRQRLLSSLVSVVAEAKHVADGLSMVKSFLNPLTTTCKSPSWPPINSLIIEN